MRTHKVGKKECLASIAWQYGFQSWKTIYDDPANEKFRAKRPNPNVIQEGDELFIPDKESKETDGATDAKHKFKVKKDSWLFRVELLDEMMKGQEDVPYTLEIEGIDPIEDMTGANGLIELLIPAQAERGTLFALGNQIDLHFAGLNPIRQVSGVQQRLNNLGFNSGPVDGIPGPKTRKALAAFQATQPDLKPTGLLDDDSLRRLIEIHDNDTRLSSEEKNAPPQNDSAESDLGGVPGQGGWDGADVMFQEPDECETCQNTGGEKIIYLTFDDGLQEGTKEVYELLTELGVPATFFFVGENVMHYEQNIEAGLFKRILDDPLMQVGNHSQTHAHEFYESFYGEGLRVNKETLEPDAVAANPAVRRSVLMDFEYANISFSSALNSQNIPRPTDPHHDFRGELDLAKLNGYSRFLTARFPGTNIWRLPKKGIKDSGDATSLGGASTKAKEDEADELALNGYKIYGWDHEFEMNFQIKAIQQERYRKGLDGHLDLYDGKFIDLDRPKETGKEVFKKVKDEFNEISGADTKQKDKLILLLHDRAFRRFKSGEENKFIDALREFIELCKKEGFKFDVVKNY